MIRLEGKGNILACSLSFIPMDICKPSCVIKPWNILGNFAISQLRSDQKPKEMLFVSLQSFKNGLQDQGTTQFNTSMKAMDYCISISTAIPAVDNSYSRNDEEQVSIESNSAKTERYVSSLQTS